MFAGFIISIRDTLILKFQYTLVYVGLVGPRTLTNGGISSSYKTLIPVQAPKFIWNMTHLIRITYAVCFKTMILACVHTPLSSKWTIRSSHAVRPVDYTEQSRRKAGGLYGAATP